MIFALLALWAESKMWYYLGMISKIIFAVSIASGVGILWMLNFTSPSSIGPIGILGFFALGYIFFLGVSGLLIYGAYRALGLLAPNNSKIKFKNRDFKFFLKYAAVLAFFPVAVIAQQSAGGFKLFEFILIVILEIIVCIYISKR